VLLYHITVLWHMYMSTVGVNNINTSLMAGTYLMNLQAAVSVHQQRLITQVHILVMVS